MPKLTKLTFNLDGLDQLRKELGNDYVARVGVLGAKNSRQSGEAMGNAEIGLIHEFGSLDKKIPARSWLRFPIQFKGKELVETIGSSTMVKAAVEAKDVKKVFKIIGIAGEAIVKQAFGSSGFGHWAPNKASTIASKGSSKPLIDTGQLQRSVTSDVARRGDL